MRLMVISILKELQVLLDKHHGLQGFLKEWEWPEEWAQIM
jgi:hypothetical protein